VKHCVQGIFSRLRVNPLRQFRERRFRIVEIKRDQPRQIGSPGFTEGFTLVFQLSLSFGDSYACGFVGICTSIVFGLCAFARGSRFAKRLQPFANQYSLLPPLGLQLP